MAGCIGPVGVDGDTGDECASWKYCAFQANGFAHGDDGAEKGAGERNCTVCWFVTASWRARSSGAGRELAYPADVAAAPSAWTLVVPDSCGDGGEKSS